MYTLTRDDDTVEPREYETLPDAMAAAECPGAGSWLVATGIPWLIHTDWTNEEQPGDAETEDGELPYRRRCWSIRAAGVAHDLIGMLTAEEVTDRTWSTWDRKVITVAMIELSSPRQCACNCAARLAAHYAAEGSLSHYRIMEVIAWAYNGSEDTELSDAEVTNGAIRVGNALAAAGFIILQPPELANYSTVDIVSTMRLDSGRLVASRGPGKGILADSDRWAAPIRAASPGPESAAQALAGACCWGRDTIRCRGIGRPSDSLADRCAQFTAGMADHHPGRPDTPLAVLDHRATARYRPVLRPAGRRAVAHLVAGGRPAGPALGARLLLLPPVRAASTHTVPALDRLLVLAPVGRRLVHGVGQRSRPGVPRLAGHLAGRVRGHGTADRVLRDAPAPSRNRMSDLASRVGPGGDACAYTRVARGR